MREQPPHPKVSTLTVVSGQSEVALLLAVRTALCHTQKHTDSHDEHSPRVSVCRDLTAAHARLREHHVSSDKEAIVLVPASCTPANAPSAASLTDGGMKHLEQDADAAQIAKPRTSPTAHEQEVRELERKVRRLQQKQEQMQHNLVSLRRKYDALKTSTVTTLWEHLPAAASITALAFEAMAAPSDSAPHMRRQPAPEPLLANIPPVDHELKEERIDATPTPKHARGAQSSLRVGSYDVSQAVLGRGSCAVVLGCARSPDASRAHDKLTARDATSQVSEPTPAVLFSRNVLGIGNQGHGSTGNDMVAAPPSSGTQAIDKTTSKGQRYTQSIVGSWPPADWEKTAHGKRHAKRRWQGFLRGNEMPLAMKVIAKDRITNHSTITQLAKEITVLRRDEMQHRRLCHVLDVLHSPHKLYVVMVRCTGEDLFSLNERFSDGLQDEIAGRIIAAVADGVRHFHGLGVCHRDLKPENIMVDLDPHGDVRRDEVRICDFGLCERMESEQDDLILGFCGSPGFFAPEMITSGSYNGAFADMWSIGCIVLEMRVGQNEFHSTWLKPAYEPDSVNNPSLFWVRIVEAHRRIFELLLTSHCADFGDRAHSKSILARLLVFEPHARFSAAEVLCHEWCSPIMDALATKPPVD